MHEVYIEGEIIRLRPYTIMDREKVVNLRNSDKGQYFLNQGFLSTVETQVAWEKGYFTREDDYYWIIECKETEEIIGTTALYDICNEVAEKGRLIVDEEKSLKKPYVLEAELLIIKYAFETLRVRRILTRTKLDNVKMKSINLRMGFNKTGDCTINNEEYEVFELVEYQPTLFEKYQSIVMKWRKREEKNEK